MVMNLASTLTTAMDFGQVFLNLKTLAQSLEATNETITVPVSKTIGIDEIKAAEDAMEHGKNLKHHLTNILRYMRYSKAMLNIMPSQAQRDNMLSTTVPKQEKHFHQHPK